MSPAKDRMDLFGITVQAKHGVLQSEKDTSQPFVVDVSLWGDFEKAQLSDALNAALDYSVLHQRIIEEVVTSSFGLIEALAGHLCRVVLAEFPVSEVSITVTKIQPPIADFSGTAAVTLRRGQPWLEKHSRAGNK